MPGQRSEIAWTDCGAPISTRFDDRYFTPGDGLSEARHVFLSGNRLAARLGPGFAVAELGFGTGLNLIALAQCWEATGREGRIAFTSFEAFPLGAGDARRALQSLFGCGECTAHITSLCDALATGARRFAVGGVDAEIVPGDARATLPVWRGTADAWFLDGFAPAKNPELWEAGLLAEVARHTRPGGTFATYTAAGRVRRALAAAGFAVERCAGYGRKRHMARGQLPGVR